MIDYTLPACVALLLGLLAVRYSPWMLFSLLLLVPIIKIVLTAYIPALQIIDPTPVACSAIGLAALWKWHRLRHNGNPVEIPWLMLCGLGTLGTMMIIGLEWSTAPDYGFRKAFRFCGIGIPFLLLPTFLIRERQDVAEFGRSILVAALVTTILIILFPQSELSVETYGETYARATPLGSDPIQPAVLAGMGVLVAIAFLLSGRLSRAKKIFTIAFILTAPLAIMMSGTRSVLVGLALPVAILCAAFLRISFLKASLFAACCIAASFLLFDFVAEITPNLDDRWSSFFLAWREGNLEILFEERWPHYQFCLSNWHLYPILGHGTGSFAGDFFGVDTPGWPHNMILEALYEWGFVGATGLVLFFVGAFIAAIKAYRISSSKGDRQSETAMLLAFTGILVFYTIHGMVHSDLDSMRTMFLMAGGLQAGMAIVSRRTVAHEGATTRETVLSHVFDENGHVPVWPPISGGDGVHES
ncbi:MAG: O-antigen ligase family protein [Chloroflexota bacterium]